MLSANRYRSDGHVLGFRRLLLNASANVKLACALVGKIRIVSKCHDNLRALLLVLRLIPGITRAKVGVTSRESGRISALHLVVLAADRIANK
jgi:hypothetical protein